MTIQYIERAAPFALDPAIALLGNEREGLAIDLLNLRAYVRDRDTPANFFLGDPNSLLTYSSPSTKWIVNKAGVLESGTALRCEYDPATGAPLGIRIETQATNLVRPSSNFNSVYWPTSLTVSTDVATAPDGTVTADKLIETSTNTYQEIQQAVSVTAGTVYTMSVFLKAAERGYAFVGVITGFPATFVAIDLNSGALTVATGAPTSSKATKYPGGWWRVELTVSATTTINSSFNIRVSADGVWANRQYLGDGASGIYLWGAQMEVATVASSYIPTVASQASRSADNISLALSKLPWSNDVVCVIADFDSRVMHTRDGYYRYPVGVTDGTSSNAIIVYRVNLTSNRGGAGNLFSAAFASVGGVSGRNRVVASVASDLTMRASANGGAVAANTHAQDLSVLNVLAIGSARAGNGALDGWLRSLVVIPRKPSDAEMQTWSAL